MLTEKKGTITVTSPSKSFLSRIIRKEFESYNRKKESYFEDDNSKNSQKCIKAAEELGLNDLAEEMRNDLLTEKI